MSAEAGQESHTIKIPSLFRGGIFFHETACSRVFRYSGVVINIIFLLVLRDNQRNILILRPNDKQKGFQNAKRGQDGLFAETKTVNLIEHYKGYVEAK